jgi:hypothetical protein
MFRLLQVIIRPFEEPIQDHLSYRALWDSKLLTLNKDSVIRECLLLFGAESFVFQFDIQKCKDQDI